MEEKISFKFTVCIVLIEFITAIIELIGNISVIKPINIVTFLITILMCIILTVTNIYIIKKNRIQTLQINKVTKKINCSDTDLYFAMKMAYKKDTDINTFTDLFITKIDSYVEELAKLFKLYAKENIVITIRFFEERKNNLDESILTILSHSEYNNKDRTKYYNQNKNKCSKKVKDNTEFYALIGNNRNSQIEYFYHGNLKEYNEFLKNVSGKSNGYKNSTLEWEQFYNAKIVVPIKIENKKLFYKKENDEDDIIGFLCADTMSSKIFTKEKEEFYTSLMQSYASRLYIILNKYYYYSNQIKGGKKHVKSV